MVKLESLFGHGLRRQWILILHSRVAVGATWLGRRETKLIFRSWAQYQIQYKGSRSPPLLLHITHTYRQDPLGLRKGPVMWPQRCGSPHVSPPYKARQEDKEDAHKLD